MGKYILKRFLQLIPIMIVISFISFSLVELSPGDPAEVILRASGGSASSEEAIEAIRDSLGLDRPLMVRYGEWLKNVAHLDFGESYRTGKPVAEEILFYFPHTLRLAVGAILLTIIISLILGIGSAVYENSIIDHLARLVSVFGISMPSFWLGLLLLYFFAVYLKWFPVAGNGDLRHMFLPMLTLALNLSGRYIRLLRTNMKEVLDKPYIMSAKARGIAKARVIWIHALKNAVLPSVTMLGMNFASLIAGTAIVETIFAWNGLGQYALNAIYARDYPVIQGYILLLSVAFVVVNLLVDISYKFIDPRIKIK